MALHKVSESGQMTKDDIDFRAENNSNCNWQLGTYDDFRDFKRHVTMVFQEIEQKMAEITTDKNKQPVIHPTSRNKETFLNTKLIRKPSNIKQGALTKDKERKKQKRRSFPVVNKYPERDMLFQVKPGAFAYSQAVQQKKMVAIICESMPKLINLSEIKRKLGRKTIVYRKPNIVIVYVRINDVLNRFDQDQIIKNIQQIYITCKIKLCQSSYNFGYCFL